MRVRDLVVEFACEDGLYDGALGELNLVLVATLASGDFRVVGQLEQQVHHGVALGQALGALELGIQLLKAGHLLLDSPSLRFGLLIDWGKITSQLWSDVYLLFLTSKNLM